MFSHKTIWNYYAVQRITIPTVSKHYARGEWNVIRNYSRNVIIKVFLSYLIISTIIIVVAKPMIVLFFSSDFVESIPLLWIMIPISLIYGVYAALDGTLAAIEKIHINVYLNLVVAIINISVNILLISLYKTQGAAIATGIFYIICKIIDLLLFRKYSVI